MFGISFAVIRLRAFFDGLSTSSSPLSSAAGSASQKWRNAFLSRPMSTNIAFKPISIFLTRPLQTLPTIWRESLRSTLYSSRRLFSSNATRRSSFSTLTTNLFPVLREVRPKIFFTLSNINFERLRDREPKHGREIVHLLVRSTLIVKNDGGPELVRVALEAV